MKTYTYETTREWTGYLDAVIGSVELRFTYTYRGPTPDHYDKSVGGPGGWTPGDDGELEIVKVEEEVLNNRPGFGGVPTRRADLYRWKSVTGTHPNGEDIATDHIEWAIMEHYDAMVEAASEPEMEYES